MTVEQLGPSLQRTRDHHDASSGLRFHGSLQRVR